LVLISDDSATAAGSKQARLACPVPAVSVISGTREKRRALGLSLRAIPAQGVYGVIQVSSTSYTDQSCPV